MNYEYGLVPVFTAEGEKIYTARYVPIYTIDGEKILSAEGDIIHVLDVTGDDFVYVWSIPAICNDGPSTTPDKDICVPNYRL